MFFMIIIMMMDLGLGLGLVYCNCIYVRFERDIYYGDEQRIGTFFGQIASF